MQEYKDIFQDFTKKNPNNNIKLLNSPCIISNLNNPLKKVYQTFIISLNGSLNVIGKKKTICEIWPSIQFLEFFSNPKLSLTCKLRRAGQ
jgi:hypothetical protein